MNTADRRTVLQVGFGVATAFLQAWHDWQRDPGRAARLEFIAIACAAPEAEALRAAHFGTPLQPLAEALAAQWPPLTRNLHRLGFDGARVQLLLGIGEPLEMLPEMQARVDLFLVDELAPSTDLRRTASRLCKGLARLAAPDARLQASAAPQALRAALVSAGFAEAAGPARISAVYAPRFTPRRRGRPAAPPAERRAVIVGAGLAGCAAAWALAEQGWCSTLLERADAPACEGSGNPAGLFHGVVNPQDGAHARFNRAAALLAQRTVQAAIDSGLARGSVRGLLRLDTRGLDVQAMRSELDALRLPPGYVQALDAQQASARCGIALQHPAWFYPGGGWVQPAALAAWFLRQAGDRAEFRGGLQVRSLHADAGRWQLLDAAGRVLAEAGTVVLANAADALRLMATPHWPVQTVRGQVSLLPLPAGLPTLPTLPLAGAGYLLPDIGGTMLFGASSQPGDTDAGVREGDHAFNLQRLARLCPAAAVVQPGRLQGRVGWRCTADDRLPLVGAVPDEAAFAQRPVERLDAVPRQPGLHVLAAFGSRGIGWAALCAQVLAARISTGAVPLESSLVQALDPARYVLRARRRACPRN